jgi:hypothetical protein
MSSIHNEIDHAKKILLITRINNEMNNLDKTDKKYKLFTNILASLTNVKISSLNETIEKINVNMYQKSWNKLHNFHKIIKIKEFIRKNFNDKNIEFQQNLECKLCDAVKAGQLNSAKLVTYDKSKSEIIKIPCLIINDANDILLKISHSKRI